jgi:N6-adenosine-specific RNA methylase IME4
MIPFPNKRYNIIYADPAWKYRLHGNVPPDREVTNHYNVLATKEIADLPVRDICENNCVLFMWVIFPKLDEFMDVVTGWGFEYKTVAFTWIKKNKNNGKNFMGLGSYTRANAEIVILGKRGKLKILDHSVMQVVESERREHSRKPDIIRDMIVRLCGDLPRIELFARERVAGWDSWGNEVEPTLF